VKSNLSWGEREREGGRKNEGENYDLDNAAVQPCASLDINESNPWSCLNGLGFLRKT